MHGLEGWKHLETAKVPGIYDAALADQERSIASEKAFEVLEQAARLEGLTISPSAAANLAGALELAEELEEGVIVTVLADDQSKYADIIAQHSKA